MTLAKEQTHLRNMVKTGASHLILDLLDPGSDLWNLGSSIVEVHRDWENNPHLSTLDDDDLMVILRDHLEDELLSKWMPVHIPATFTALCILLGDVEWDLILPQLIEEYDENFDYRQKWNQTLDAIHDVCPEF